MAQKGRRTGAKKLFLPRETPGGLRQEAGETVKVPFKNPCLTSVYIIPKKSTFFGRQKNFFFIRPDQR
jgi:hypothetical protein